MIDSENDPHDLGARRQVAQESRGATLQERLAARGEDPRMLPTKPRKKRADGRGGGARRSVAAAKRDIEQVAAYLADGRPRWWIVEHYGKRKVPSSTVDRWIGAVRERMQADLRDEMPTLREKLLGQIRKQRNACIAEGDQTNARHYFKLEMELCGMQAPEDHKHVHLHAPVAPAPPERTADELLGALGPSDEELAALAALAEKASQKRAQALPALPAPEVLDGEVIGG